MKKLTLGEARKICKKTQGEVSDLLKKHYGISLHQTTVSAVERGYRGLRDQYKKPICEIIGFRSNEIKWPTKTED